MMREVAGLSPLAGACYRGFVRGHVAVSALPSTTASRHIRGAPSIEAMADAWVQWPRGLVQ